MQVWRAAPNKTAADMAEDDGPLGAAPLDPLEEDGDGTPSLSGEESGEESEESEAEMAGESQPAGRPRTSAYRHQQRGQPGRRRRRTGVRLVGGVAGFDPDIMAQVDSAVGSSVGDDDGAEEGDAPEADADEGAPNGQSQARRLPKLG